MDCLLQIKEVKINDRLSAIGIDTEQPSFSFKLDAKGQGASCTAYQIKVFEYDENHLVWDSDKRGLQGAPYIQYEGESLKARTKYYCLIRVWDNKDQVSDYYDPVNFETGFMKTKWKAKWIEPIQNEAELEKELSFRELFIPNPEFWGGEKRLKPCQTLKKEIRTRKTVKKARLYASAHGVYDININGKEISKSRLAPETSVYESYLYYQTYDVTEFLTEDSNTLKVTLGDGWWIGRLGITGESCNYGNKLGFIMELHIDYEDGSQELIISDKSFQSQESNIRYSDLFIGECVDYSYRIDEKAWTPCIETEATSENLIGQFLDPIQIVEEIELQKIIETPKGELVFDFGQVIAGVCRFEVMGKEGQIISFEHSEVLDKDGNYMNNIIGRNKDQKDVLICKEGLQIFEPKFTYHGFRYVRVTNCKPEHIKVKALVIGSKLQHISNFKTSHEGINKLQKAIEWSTIGNMCSVPTDCPQREKLGWTGDIQVFSPTGLFNFDLKNFLESWLENLRAAQFDNGEVPVTVPNHPYQDKTQRILGGGSNSSSGWGDACILLPYYMYQYYGDSKILEDNYETMEQWLSFIKKQCAIKEKDYDTYSEEKKDRQEYLWTKGYHFGDWLIPSLRDLPNGVDLGTQETRTVVGACFYGISVKAFIDICRWLGKDEEVKRYEELLLKIQKAIADEFIDDDGKVNKSQLQGLYVMTLKAGILDKNLRKKVADNLATLIKENNYRLDTGFSSVSYLLDVLYDNGYEDIAYKLLYQDQSPSWLYMINNGATTIWENWKAIKADGSPTDSSFNHYAFGCIGDWLYRRLGGIQSKEPGYTRLEIKPDFSCGLDFVECSTYNVFGKISVSWKAYKDEYRLTIELPVNTEAIVIGQRENQILQTGKHQVTIRK